MTFSGQRFLRWVIALLLLAVGATAHAHFPSGYDIRVVHFLRGPDGLDAYFRLTLPLVVARDLGPLRPDGNREPAPFTVLRIESAHGFYYPDVARMRAEPIALGRMIADGHRLDVGTAVLHPQVLSVRVYPNGLVPPFNTLEEAKAATATGPAYPENAPEVDAAYVVVDTHFIYPYPGRVQSFELSSTLDNRILGQPEVQNLLVDHTGEKPLIYRRTGLLEEPVALNASLPEAMVSFARHGAEHVLQGMDHLLFIACLALGALTLPALIWRITAFTVGHAISLAVGFFGYVPKQAWFIPAVETAIAASIVLAAVSLALRWVPHRAMMSVTLAIGLIHGLGFAFVLRELLAADGPHVWPSLAAFNLGVEAGQALVAATIWLLAFYLARTSAQLGDRVRVGIAIGCAAISLIWLVQRGQMLVV